MNALIKYHLKFMSALLFSASFFMLPE